MARREYPGVYPYPAARGRKLYRTLYTDSNGRQRQKRGFSSPSAGRQVPLLDEHRPNISVRHLLRDRNDGCPSLDRQQVA